MTFSFFDKNGNRHVASIKTWEPEKLEDDENEAILYDPLDPSNAAAIDTLPGKPVFDKNGNITSSSSGSALLYIIIPGITVVGHLIWFLSKQ